MAEKSRMTVGLLPGVVLIAAVTGLLVAVWPNGSDAASADAPPRGQAQTGLATFYGPGFHGDRTASGERFDQNRITAAHRTLPLGTRVRVTNLENGEGVTFVINDRGPYGRNRNKGTIIDVSKTAARWLDFGTDGLTRVRLEVLDESAQEGRAGVE
jgi:rare lipoprotein A